MNFHSLVPEKPFNLFDSHVWPYYVKIRSQNYLENLHVLTSNWGRGNEDRASQYIQKERKYNYLSLYVLCNIN